MIEAIILGIIQGIAEFLPISSSAHLIIFRDIFGIGNSMGDSALAFDLALHLGTALAIIIYFFKDFWNMFLKGVTKGPKDKEGKMMWFIIAATIPAALIGVLFEETIEEVIRGEYYLIASALIMMGIIIYLSDKYSKISKDVTTMTIKDAILIGCSQVFALIPGFSRSGTTIATARIMNLKREDAAKFSFYLSAPVVLGAAVWFVINRGIDPILDNISLFFTGTLVAFIIGIICIKFLLKYLRKNDFKLFMWYRVALGLFVIIYLIIK